MGGWCVIWLMDGWCVIWLMGGWCVSWLRLTDPQPGALIHTCCSMLSHNWWKNKYLTRQLCHTQEDNLNDGAQWRFVTACGAWALMVWDWDRFLWGFFSNPHNVLLLRIFGVFTNPAKTLNVYSGRYGRIILCIDQKMSLPTFEADE